jgi:hypothetical protein
VITERSLEVFLAKKVLETWKGCRALLLQKRNVYFASEDSIVLLEDEALVETPFPNDDRVLLQLGDSIDQVTVDHLHQMEISDLTPLIDELFDILTSLRREPEITEYRLLKKNIIITMQKEYLQDSSVYPQAEGEIK